MFHKKKFIISGVLALVIVIIGGVAILTNDNLKIASIISEINRSNKMQNITENGHNDHQRLSAEQLELRKEYYYLLKDLDNMIFFRNFSTPENIPAEDLLLFGYTKASESGSLDKSGGVELSVINTFTKKYFNRTLTGSIKNGYFSYDANADRYIPTGWDLNVFQPHYLVKISNNIDGTITANFEVYLFSESDILDKFPDEYIADTSLIPSQIKHELAECTFYRKSDNGRTYLQMVSYKRQNDKLMDPITSISGDYKAATYDSNNYLGDDEFVFIGGIRLGMSYENVLEILGGYDEAYDNAPGVKSIFKDGLHYGFYQINDTFSNQSDLEIDGVFRLLNLSSDSYQGEFPRGIKIGDNIEDVLNKFPGKDKKLRKWARQTIYGKDEIGSPRAYLEFTMYNECYRIFATTSSQILIINFDRKNQVRSVEMIKEDS